MGSKVDAPLVIVTAADDAYALPLAVTIRSALDHLPAAQPLDLYVFDGGLTPLSKQRLLSSWSRPGLTVHWLAPPLSEILQLKTESHLNFVTYLRLFMPRMLPQEYDRAIFLDADLLVQRNLQELWSTNLGDAPLAAVNDYFTPYLNTREAIGRASICDRYPEARLPIPNYEQLGLAGAAAYFNAGVMLINLDRWRELDVLDRAIQLLEQHREHVRFCDQYALNILFSELWLPLDPRWNQNSNVWAWAGPDDGALDPRRFRTLRRDPWIVHFTWTRKPWHHGCTHPATRAFFKVADRTDWRGWRPPAPPRNLAQRMGDGYLRYRAWYRQHVSPTLRSLKIAAGLKNKAA